MTTVIDNFNKLALDVQRLVFVNLTLEEHITLSTHPLLINKPISNDNDIVWAERIQNTFGMNFSTRKDIHNALIAYMEEIGKSVFFSRYGVYHKLIPYLDFENLSYSDNDKVVMILRNLNLLQNNIDVQDRTGKTLLHRAVLYETWAVDGLINAKININTQDKQGYTALMRAISLLTSPKAIVKKLIANNAALNNRTDHGWTALMLACERSKFSTAKILIKAGANVNIKNKDEWIALMILIIYSIDTYKRASSHAEKDKITKKTKEVMQLLIDASVDLDVKISGNGYTALMMVVNRSEGAETFCCELLKMLIGAGASIDVVIVNQWTPLTMVVNQFKTAAALQIIRLLINEGANVNYKNKDGMTPLMLAVKNSTMGCSEEVVKMLLINGKADVDARTKLGDTALLFAVMNYGIHSSKKTIKMLLAAGADVTIENHAGLTAWSIAEKFPAVDSKRLRRMLTRAENNFDKQERFSDQGNWKIQQSKKHKRKQNKDSQFPLS